MNHKLRLYITGQTAASHRVVDNIREICETELDGRYELEVIDLLEHPQLAERENILATPTLVRELPPPMRKVIGDLSQRSPVAIGLGLVGPEQSDDE